MKHIVTKPDANVAAEYTVAQVIALLTAATAKDTASLVLAGGSSFKQVYALLAEEKNLDWSKVHIWFGDERAVPSTDESSNYKMAYDAWLHIFDGQNGPIIHRIHGERGAEAAARHYEQELQHILAASRLDVVLLGVGPDGHTASIFPGQLQALLKEPQLVMAAKPEREPFVDRITLTPYAFNLSQNILVLITGAHKQPIAQKIQNGGPPEYPIEYIQPINGNLAFVLDNSSI